jgi:hypothetical protein
MYSKNTYGLGPVRVSAPKFLLEGKRFLGAPRTLPPICLMPAKAGVIKRLWILCANNLAKLCGLARHLPTQTTAKPTNTKNPVAYPQHRSPQIVHKSTSHFSQITDTVHYISTLSTYTTITTTLIYKGE